MVSTSKILTVSYGTFSCTLEGFDDSFDTMKAIAEYFRDLAADDRYFGAEPPSPDAEMLARIAEREIARRVEARDTDGRIHLRAADSAGDNAADTPSSAARLPYGSDVAAKATDSSAMSPARDMAERVQTPSPETEAQTDDLPADDAPEAPETPEAEAMETPAPRHATAPHDPAESVADKLRRIRAVANPGSAAFSGGYTEDEHAQDFLTSTAADLDDALAQDDAAELASETDETRDVAHHEAPDEEAPAEAVEEPSEEPTTDETPEDTGAPDITQDVLSALSAEDIAEEADDATGFATADETTPGDDSSAEDDIQAHLAPDIETAAAPAPAPEVEETDLIEPQEDEDDTVDEVLDTPEAASDGLEDTLAQLMADAMQPDEASPAPAQRKVESDDDTAQPEAADTTETAEDERPLEARVIKMKRTEFETAMTEIGLEDEGDDDDSGLSPEEEAELQRELAEVEAEFTRPSEPASTDEHEAAEEQGDADQEDGEAHRAEDIATQADDARSEPEPEPAGADRLGNEADDAETDRMFREADTQLDESEGSERRSAIQHLRAAVAATRAEKSAGGDITSTADVAPYQLDLEQAVRPRRPVASGTARAERPSQEQSAPLRLVAEQRIDQPTEPVRPRRVSHSELLSETQDAAVTARHDSADDASFADYAEKVGANNLTDLLEAAAAYLSDVEGREQFSRPMLMHKLREIDEDGFTREDGLRSFGQLLRTGKLQKLKGGRFAVTDDTDFRQAG